jgi:hypothetical protein
LAIAASLADAKGLDMGKSHVSEFNDSTDAWTNDEETVSASSSRKLEYPPLPEEPNVGRDLLCRVGIRLPGGHRLQRNFLRTDSVKVCIIYYFFVIGFNQPLELYLKGSDYCPGQKPMLSSMCSSLSFVYLVY